jgi:hypothetical protein
MQSTPNKKQGLVRDVVSGLLRYISFVAEGANHSAIVEEIFQSSAIFSKIVFPAGYDHAKFLSHYNINNYGQVVTKEDGTTEVFSNTYVYKPNDLAHTTEEGVTFYTSSEVLHKVSDTKQELREALESMEMFSVNPKMLDLIVNSDLDYWPDSFSHYNLFDALASTVRYLASNDRTDLVDSTVARFEELHRMQLAHLEALKENTAASLGDVEPGDESLQKTEDSSEEESLEETPSEEQQPTPVEKLQSQVDNLTALVEQQSVAFKAAIDATEELRQSSASLKEQNEKLQASLEDTNQKLNQYNAFVEKSANTSTESFASKEAPAKKSKHNYEITSNIISL